MNHLPTIHFQGRTVSFREGIHLILLRFFNSDWMNSMFIPVNSLESHNLNYPKDHWTLKTGNFEDLIPAMQVQTLPFEGPRSLGYGIWVHGRFQKYGFLPPNHPFVHRVWNHYKPPSILGVFHSPYFGGWKSPYFWFNTHMASPKKSYHQSRFAISPSKGVFATIRRCPLESFVGIACLG